MIDACIAGVLHYAEDTGLIEADDRLWARNRLLEALQLDGCDPDCAAAELPLADLLRELTEDAVSRGVAQDNSVARDLFDTKLMGVLTPAPHEVRAKFRSLYAVSLEQHARNGKGGIDVSARSAAGEYGLHGPASFDLSGTLGLF